MTYTVQETGITQNGLDNISGWIFTTDERTGRKILQDRLIKPSVRIEITKAEKARITTRHSVIIVDPRKGILPIKKRFKPLPPLPVNASVYKCDVADMLKIRQTMKFLYHALHNGGRNGSE